MRVSWRPFDAGGRDHLLRHVVAEGLDRREVAATDLVGLLLGHLLDVDAADRGEDHHRLLAQAVPDDAGVVLLLHLGLGVHQHAARHVAADLELEDVLRVVGGLVGAVGELHAAGLHAAAGEHLGLDHGRAADPVRDLARLLVGGGEPEVGDRNPGPLDDLAGLVLEEAHGGAEPYRDRRTGRRGLGTIGGMRLCGNRARRAAGAGRAGECRCGRAAPGGRAPAGLLERRAAAPRCRSPTRSAPASATASCT